MRGINQLYQKHSRYLFISAWILWALFLLLLHRQAFMHSDDFGYASLSYGWEGNSHGMAWNIGDLFAFLKWHYLNWGGRILYFGLLTPLLHAGEPVIQVFQAFVFFGVTYMAYTLIKREKTDLPAALAVMAAFGTIGRETVTDGVLWYTAAAVYIWPMLPLYGAIAWMKKDSRRSGWKTAGLCLLMFASGFSHEQIAAMLLIYCVARLIQEGTEKKRIRASVLLPLLCGIAGALLEILAPGNFARAGTIPEFYDLSLAGKIQRNLPLIFQRNLDKPNVTFSLLLMGTLFVAALRLGREAKTKKAGRIIMGSALAAEGVLAVSWVLTNETIKSILFACFLLIFCILIGILLFRKEKYLFALFLGAICSQGMMLFSPEVEPRTTIPFQLICQLAACFILVRALRDVRPAALSQAALGGLLAAGVILWGILFIGYYGNVTVNRENRAILREQAQRIQAGETTAQIELRQLPKLKFSTGMPYFKDLDYINYWIREYYGIPHSVELIYLETPLP